MLPYKPNSYKTKPVIQLLMLVFESHNNKKCPTEGEAKNVRVLMLGEENELSQMLDNILRSHLFSHIPFFPCTWICGSKFLTLG